MSGATSSAPPTIQYQDTQHDPRKAIAEREAGKRKKSATVDNLMADLHADD